MIRLSSDLEKNIRADGEAAYPNECCGVLIGEVDNEGIKTVKSTLTIDKSSYSLCA